jgi:hypothetical protein
MAACEKIRVVMTKRYGRKRVREREGDSKRLEP